MVTGDAGRLDAFVSGLPHGYTPVAVAHNSLRVEDLNPADLGRALSLAEERGLTAELVQGPKWLVTSVSSRLCAWEFDLASEALAKRACCTSCRGILLCGKCRASTGLSKRRPSGVNCSSASI